MMIKYFLPLLVFVFTNCGSVKSTQEVDEAPSMEDVALSRFGDKYASIENESGSHTIVFKKYKKMEDLFATVKFFVFEENSQSVIFQDELNAGSVSWYSDFEIIGTSRSSKTDQNQESTTIYYYDVIKRKKVDK